MTLDQFGTWFGTQSNKVQKRIVRLINSKKYNFSEIIEFIEVHGVDALKNA